MGTITDRLSVSNTVFDANFAINIKARSQFQNQTRYWLNIVPDVAPTACLVTVNYTPVGGASIAAIDADGNPITIDLTNPKPVYIDGDVGVITLVHSGLTAGSMTSYQVMVSADTGGNGQAKGAAFPVTPFSVSASSAGAATVTATMPAVAGKKAYLTGFTITSGGATVGSLVDATVTGLIGGTATYTIGVVTGATLANPIVSDRFTPAIPASANNVAIVLSVPSLGTGNTKCSLNLFGYYK